MAENKNYKFVGYYEFDEELLKKTFTGARKIYKKHGFMRKMGFRKTPAITTVDMAKARMSEGHPFTCNHSEEVCVNALKVLETGRKAGVPIFHTTTGYADKQQWDLPRQDEKTPMSTLDTNSEWLEIDPKLKPLPEEPVIHKKCASNPSGTHLVRALNSLGMDTLTVMGATSYMYVRHTVMDSTGYGFKIVVLEGTVGDRVLDIIERDLSDMEAKLADVIPVDEMVEYLEGVDSNVYTKRERSMDQ